MTAALSPKAARLSPSTASGTRPEHRAVGQAELGQSSPKKFVHTARRYRTSAGTHAITLYVALTRARDGVWLASLNR